MPLAQYRHYDCRITDELTYKGYQALFLENDLLRIGVLVGKGADLFQFLHKPTDTDFLWRSPIGLINPSRNRATKASAAGVFLDTYHGGWQEILPGGGPVDYAGAELGLHGEVTHLGWEYDILVDDPERISVRFRVDNLRTPFRLERTMSLERGKAALFFEETLTNLSPEPQQFMWGHHPAFGAPFLREGVRLSIPAARAEVHEPKFAASGVLEPGLAFDWPLAPVAGQEMDLSLVPGPDAGFAELIYLSELSSGYYAVVDPDRKLGFGLAWPKEVYPYLWFWLVYGRAPGYPWWDRVYCIALEPWTSIPNNLDSAINRGVQKIIKGGESLHVTLCAVVSTGRETINEIGLDGSVR